MRGSGQSPGMRRCGRGRTGGGCNGQAFRAVERITRRPSHHTRCGRIHWRRRSMAPVTRSQHSALACRERRLARQMAQDLRFALTILAARHQLAGPLIDGVIAMDDEMNLHCLILCSIPIPALHTQPNGACRSADRNKNVLAPMRIGLPPKRSPIQPLYLTTVV